MFTKKERKRKIKMKTKKNSAFSLEIQSEFVATQLCARWSLNRHKRMVWGKGGWETKTKQWKYVRRSNYHPKKLHMKNRWLAFTGKLHKLYTHK